MPVEECYSYDSTVGNHRRVSVGDHVVVRSGRETLGIGHIEELEVLPYQTKRRSQCPHCGSTGVKERTTEQPRCRCSPCANVFDDPKSATIPVTGYRAHRQPRGPWPDHAAVHDLSRRHAARCAGAGRRRPRLCRCQGPLARKADGWLVDRANRDTPVVEGPAAGVRGDHRGSLPHPATARAGPDSVQLGGHSRAADMRLRSLGRDLVQNLTEGVSREDAVMAGAGGMPASRYRTDGLPRGSCGY